MEPAIHDTYMIQRKDQCAEDDACLFFALRLECLIKETPEEAFFQERIDQDDVGEDEQEILFAEMFLADQTVSDAAKIDIAAKQKI